MNVTMNMEVLWRRSLLKWQVGSSMLILCPFLFDQFYWAKRMFWLGVSPEPLKRCDMVPVDGNYTSIKEAAEKLARSISYALSPEVRACALEVAEKLSLEEWHISSLSGHGINFIKNTRS
ncbi:uncharacterized protein LOC141707887 isoform X2 [Apium graveolens]|uniref:uncharacterized protein LOC141707887 isoform X2 n=1 Tax=Apium graveolens TaxID=4045 RepID=UPI003D78E08D